jgi:hypothetical protein
MATIINPSGLVPVTASFTTQTIPANRLPTARGATQPNLVHAPGVHNISAGQLSLGTQGVIIGVTRRSGPYYNLTVTFTHSGGIADTGFGGIFFGRIYALPSKTDVGKILSDFESTFDVHNAIVDPAATGHSNSLVDMLVTGDTAGVATRFTRGGLDIENIAGFPVKLNANHTINFTYRISGTGKNKFETLFTPTPANIVPTTTHTLVGERALVFPFVPQNPVTEALEFKTSLLQSRDGTETRIAERANPRQSFKMTYLIDQQDPKMYQVAQSNLIGLPGITVGVGMWQQTSRLSQAVAPGEQTIFLDTTSRDFRPGGFAMIWNEWNQNEPVAITSVTDTSITLNSPTLGTWAPGTWVVPLRPCIAKDNPSTSLTTSRVAKTSVEWLDQTAYSGLEENELYLTSYLGKPVLDDDMLIDKEYESNLVSGMAVIDGSTGVRTYVTNKPTRPSGIKMWDVSTLQDSIAVRKFLVWCKGRQKSFWVPTHTQDLTVTPGQTLDVNSTNLLLEATGYSEKIQAKAPYNHIVVKYKDGEIIYCEVIDHSHDTDTDTDTIVTAPAVATQLRNSDDIEEISFLILSRLDSDKFNTKHTGQGRARTSGPLIGVKQ